MYQHKILESLMKPSDLGGTAGIYLAVYNSIVSAITRYKFYFIEQFDDLIKATNLNGKAFSTYVRWITPYPMFFICGQDEPGHRFCVFVESISDPTNGIVVEMTFISYMKSAVDMWIINPAVLRFYPNGMSKLPTIHSETLGIMGSTVLSSGYIPVVSDIPDTLIIPLVDNDTFDSIASHNVITKYCQFSYIIVERFLMLLRCKNTIQETIQPDAKLLKIRAKRNKPPIYAYKILKIELPKSQQKRLGKTYLTINEYAREFDRASTIRDCTKGKGLFGKLHGLFIIPAHKVNKGSPYKLDKDYRVVVKKEGS